MEDQNEEKKNEHHKFISINIISYHTLDLS